MKTQLLFRKATIILIMALLGISYQAHAQYSFSGGKGTITEPYQIKNAQQLDSLRYFMGSEFEDVHFCLMNNIDLTSFLQGSTQGWIPIGSLNEGKSFRAKLHGNGYKITNLFIARPETQYIGFFGYTSGASIDNLGIELHEIGISGDSRVGGLIGYASYSTLISACHVSGAIAGNSYVGGLVGMTDNSVSINYCYTQGMVSGSSPSSGNVGGLVGFNANTSITASYSKCIVDALNVAIGGLVGFNSGNSSIKACYATGNVSSSAGGHVGGLVGSNFREIYASYATGSVSGHGDNVGGLVGLNNKLSDNYGTINNCYATGSTYMKNDMGYVAALSGANSGYIEYSYATGHVTAEGQLTHSCGITAFNISNAVVTDCHFDQGTTMVQYGIYQMYPTGPSQYLLPGNTTGEMMQQATFENWNFDTIWSIKEGESYPFFKWQTYRKSLLASITLDKGVLDPVFSPGNFAYTVTLPAGTTNITIDALPVQRAIVSGDTGEQTLSSNDQTFTLIVTAVGAPSYTYTIRVKKEDDPTGINTTKAIASTIKLYPNPVTHGKLTVENTEGRNNNMIQLFDITGKLLQTIVSNDKIEEINMAHLPAGIYWIKVGNTTHKIIHQ